MDKLIGFAPDADSTTPGVLTTCVNLIPFDNGMRSAPSGLTPAGVPALAAECRGSAVVTKLDDSRRVIAGTTTKLYELTGGAWVDSGGTYTGGTETRWSLAQFGNATLASNLADTIQRSSGAGFTDIAGAPKAKIIFSVGTQIMALNVNDGAIKNDGWHCCATFDETDWVESVTTLCASGRIVSQPGSFTAGARLGEYAVAYKANAIFMGQFVGAPSVWDWTQVVGGDFGCVGQDAVCDIGSAHFFVGNDGFYLFDGSRPIPIGEGSVSNFFKEDCSPVNRTRTQCVFDRLNNVVWVFYCSEGASIPDRALVYHVGTKMWGAANMTVESTLNFVSAGVTIDGLTALSATIDGLTEYSFDSNFWVTGGRSLAAFNSAHQLQSLTGPATTAGFVTGDVGDDDVVSLLSQLRLRFAPGFKPTSASVQTFTRSDLGDDLLAGSSSTMTEGKFDVMDSARWHRASFTLVGDCRVIAMGAKVVQGGIW